MDRESWEAERKVARDRVEARKAAAAAATTTEESSD